MDLTATTITGGLWRERQTVNTTGTLRHVLGWLERTGWLANFDHVAEGTTSGRERPGLCFSDSEVYKFMEALAWEHARTGDAWADATFQSLTSRVAAAQDADGYLNTAYGHEGLPSRWSDLAMGHELYVAGHLLQAAVARVRGVGRDALVEVAVRVADQLCAEFGPAGRPSICGHPEIELGLAELGRALGEPRYLEQARLFIDRRGAGLLGDQPFGRSYFQDDEPVRQAEVLRGHAVRALYLSAAAVDVAVEDEDQSLLDQVEKQWRRTVARRTYLTGGMGSRHQDEGFGEDWELPADRAYCETCAGIASVMLSWRLLLAADRPAYGDLMERTLFNVVAASPGDDGNAFFYANPLHQRDEGEDVDLDRANPRAESSARAPWFEVSCCPTNLARTFASLSGYLATIDTDGLALHQYATSTVSHELPTGEMRLEVSTRYPDDELVSVEVLSAPARATLRLRVPDWCEGATVRRVIGDEGGALQPVAPGYVVLEGPWERAERVELRLPVPARVTRPDPRIDAVRGCVAVERGPDVLCVESIDLPAGWSLDEVVFEGLVDATPEGDTDRPLARLARRTPTDGGWAYGAETSGQAGKDVARVRLSRYRDWGRRGLTSMRVWLPTS